MTPHRKISIVIADDHPIFRDGLRRLLDAESDLHVVGVAGDGHEALALARSLKPDVMLLDLSMRHSALDVLKELDLEKGKTPVRAIVLTAAIDESQALEALQLGARGVVLKESVTSLLLKSVRVVHEGQYWVGREAVSSLVEGLRKAQSQDGTPVRFGLTPRELQVVKAIRSVEARRLPALVAFCYPFDNEPAGEAVG